MKVEATSPSVRTRAASREQIQETQQAPAKRRRLSASLATGAGDAAPTDRSGTDSNLYDEDGTRKLPNHGSQTLQQTSDSTEMPSSMPQAGDSAERVAATALPLSAAAPQQFTELDMSLRDALFNDSATLQTAFQRMQAANGARSSSGGGGDSGSPSHIRDSADELDSDEEAEGDDDVDAPQAGSTPAAAQGGKLYLPRFEKPSHSGKPWPAAYHTALIKFIAQDVILRGFMTVGSADGSTASLRRFSDLTEGPTAKTLQRVLTKYRNAYNTLKEKLSAGGLSTRTLGWKEPKDWAWLEKCESHHVVKWLRVLHDEVFVDYHNGVPRAIMIPTGESAGRPAVQKSSSRAAPSTSKAVANPQALSKPASVKLSPTAPQRSNDVASSSAAPAFSGISSHLSSLSARTESQFAALQEQLKQQGLHIALLQAQNEQQGQLLGEQAGILQQQADEAEAHTKEVKTQARRLDAQAEKIDCQSEALKRIEEQVASLSALAGDRT